MPKLIVILLSMFLVTSCQTWDQGSAHINDMDGANGANNVQEANKVLESWWSFFSDPVLDRLITSAIGLNAIGEGRKTFPKDNMNILALQDYYTNQNVGLVKNVVLDYVEYRYIQNQNILLGRYIDELEFNLRDAGHDQGDIISAELDALVARESEFEMRLKKLSLKIASLTKLLPEYVSELLKEGQSIPTYDITPLLLEDTYSLFNHSARIKAERALAVHKSVGLSSADLMAVFPSIPLNKFFGISDQVFAKSDSPWRVSIGNAVRELDLDRLDSIGFRKEGVEKYRNAVSSYVSDIERMLVSYSTLIEQERLLSSAVDKAHDKDVYKARLAALRAEYEKTKVLISLFEALSLH